MSADWVGDDSRRTPVGRARRSDGPRRNAPIGWFKLPRFTWRAAVAVLGVGSTLTVSLVASTASGPIPVAISGWSGPSYAKDVTGFHPLSGQLVVDLATSKKPSSSVAAGSASPAIAAGSPTGSTPTSTTTQGPTLPPQDQPPVVGPPAPAPPQPSLSIEFTADRAKTHPNGAIIYSIKVLNAGPGTATDVVVTSHIPDGTTLAGWTCGIVNFQANGKKSFACGGATSNTHPVVFGISSLAPGTAITERFWVTVNHDVLRHTDLTNHAHVYAHDVDPVDSDVVSVLIP